MTVLFRQQSLNATTNDGGDWHAVLQPKPAGGPDTLSIDNGTHKTAINDVPVGEVWLASGQSNLAFKLKAMGAEQPSEFADDCRLRTFQVELNAQDQPSDTLAGAWRPVSP